MTELDQVWSQMLAEAAMNATGAGRRAVAEYLRLKADNDAIRTVGVGWLFDSFMDIAGEAVRKHTAIAIEREEPHNFAHGNSNMVGSFLSIRHGVRCLTVEAGWTRTPRDGIMRGGSLAVAHISHFGLPRATDEFRLVHVETLPKWLTTAGDEVNSAELARHFNLFIEG